ncbi:hypothetical protein EON79_10110 [bacterium]|nr:MAG: hypothetical protein EON79_10110 [bacterium]
MLDQPLAPTVRKLGCGCVLVPSGLVLMGALFGLLLGEGPQANGRVGWEPDRPAKQLAVLALLGLTLVGGLAFLSGRPITLGRSVNAGLFWSLAVIGGLVTVQTPSGICIVATGIAGALAIFVVDRQQSPAIPDPQSLPPEVKARDRRLAHSWGKVFLGFGAFLGTFGIWMAWPRDPAKTTSAPEVTAFLALAFAAWGWHLRSNSKAEASSEGVPTPPVSPLGKGGGADRRTSSE